MSSTPAPLTSAQQQRSFGSKDPVLDDLRVAFSRGFDQSQRRRLRQRWIAVMASVPTAAFLAYYTAHLFHS